MLNAEWKPQPLPLESGLEEVLSEEAWQLAQNPLTRQGEDHQVTTASWGPCSPLPRSHIWHNSGGGSGPPEPRQPGGACGGSWGPLA